MGTPAPSPTLFAAAIIVSALALTALSRVPAPAPVAAPARPVRAQPTSEGAAQLRAGEPLDLNRAAPGDLLLLPGVGPKLAARIVEERTRRGGFASVDQLAQVKGVGPKKLAQLRMLVAITDPKAKPP